MNPSDNERLKFLIERAKRLTHLGSFDEGVLKILNEILKIAPMNEYALNELLKTDKKNIGVLNSKGKALNNHYRYEEAIRVFDEILKEDPKNVAALKNKEYALKYQEVRILCEKGNDLDKLDKYLEAIECYEEALKIDPEYPRVAIESKKRILDEINEWKGVTKESALKIIQKNDKEFRDSQFRYAPKEFRNDKEFVLNAVRLGGGNMLKYVSSELIDDREVVLMAVRKFGWAIQYATQKLQNDREIVLEAVKNETDVLSIVSLNFQDDVEVVRAAISSDTYKARYTTILQDVSPRLRSNRNIVLKAVESFGLEIKYANPCFYNDEEIIFTAFENIRYGNWEYEIYAHISPRLRKKIRGKIKDLKNEENSALLTDKIAEVSDKMMNGLENMFMYFSDYEKETRKEKREWEEKEEKEWQIAYKNYQEQWKHDTEQWQSKMVQWQQDQKYKNYVKFRVKLEQMPMYGGWKKDVTKKCGNKCQLEKSHADRYAEVHHIDSLYSIYLNNNLTSNEKIIKCKKLWDVNNGIVLCKECHDTMESSQNRQAMMAKT